jgi:hypothetical protein
MTYNAHVLLIPLDRRAFSLGYLVRFHSLSRSPNDRPLLTLMSVTVKIMGNHGSFAIFHDLTHFLIQNCLTGCI